MTLRLPGPRCDCGGACMGRGWVFVDVDSATAMRPELCPTFLGKLPVQPAGLYAGNTSEVAFRLATIDAALAHTMELWPVTGKIDSGEGSMGPDDPFRPEAAPANEDPGGTVSDVPNINRPGGGGGGAQP